MKLAGKVALVIAFFRSVTPRLGTGGTRADVARINGRCRKKPKLAKKIEGAAGALPLFQVDVSPRGGRGDGRQHAGELGRLDILFRQRLQRREPFLKADMADFGGQSTSRSAFTVCASARQMMKQGQAMPYSSARPGADRTVLVVYNMAKAADQMARLLLELALPASA